MLSIGPVNFEWFQEPPAPVDMPRRVRGTLLEALGIFPEVFIYTGTSSRRIIRFVSSEEKGFVTPDQKNQLRTLYEARTPFTVTTDLMGTRSDTGSTALNYPECYFSYDEGITFAPHPVPTGTYWYFDLPIRMP